MLGGLIYTAAALAFQAPCTLRPHSPARRGTVLQLRGGAALQSLGAFYAASLVANPIATKSITAGAIFALSDVAGQAISPPKDGPDLKRTTTSLAVGLLYFGPALHFWLGFVTKLLPDVSVKSTLLKTLMGQALFGPTVTSIFFAASLISNNGLLSGLKQWPAKLKKDLISTWAAGLCFWPFVDLFVYSLLPVAWIPLGYNVASFFWTIFLSLQAAKQE